MAKATGYLPRLDSREAFVDHLEGYTEPTVEELEDGKLNRKLLKTYMLALRVNVGFGVAVVGWG